MYVTFQSQSGCIDSAPANTSAKDEQAHTEDNQRRLNSLQPAPSLDWSMERDNLTKRELLQNDRSINFFVYIFNEGIADPIGYYQVNKLSSVNSQLTNPMQLVRGDYGQYHGDFVLPSPAEDGSYGENGSGMFGFTPEEIYIESNMHYVISTVPLTFTKAVNRLAVINTDEAKKLLGISKKVLDRVPGRPGGNH